MPEQVRQRVAGHYPEAEPVPERPALDALLEPLGLQWTGEEYRRPGESFGTSSLLTTISSLHQSRTALPTQARAMTEEAIAAREFDDRLRNAVEQRAFRAASTFIPLCTRSPWTASSRRRKAAACTCTQRRLMKLTS